MKYTNLMYECSLLILVILSLKCVLTSASYEDILLNEKIDDKLKLLRPENILKNYRFIHNSGGSTSAIDTGAFNTSCARDLDLFLLALDKREPWALKSKD